MIIQVVIIAGLLACLAYAFLQRKKSKHVSAALSIVAVAGLVFASAPDLTNRLAHWVGVGRGADLMLYCWLLISLIVSVNLQFKILALQQNVTDLTREISLLNFRTPQANPKDVDPTC